MRRELAVKKRKDWTGLNQGDPSRFSAYATAYYDPRADTDPPIPLPAVPYLKLAAVAREDGGLTVFALNRALSDEMAVEASIGGFGPLRVREAITMSDCELNAVNTRDAPDRIKPRPLDGVRVNDGRIHATLPPASWTVLSLAS